MPPPIKPRTSVPGSGVVWTRGGSGSACGGFVYGGGGSWRTPAGTGKNDAGFWSSVAGNDGGMNANAIRPVKATAISAAPNGRATARMHPGDRMSYAPYLEVAASGPVVVIVLVRLGWEARGDSILIRRRPGKAGRKGT